MVLGLVILFNFSLTVTFADSAPFLCSLNEAGAMIHFYPPCLFALSLANPWILSSSAIISRQTSPWTIILALYVSWSQNIISNCLLDIFMWISFQHLNIKVKKTKLIIIKLSGVLISVK